MIHVRFHERHLKYEYSVIDSMGDVIKYRIRWNLDKI